jgi:hypothetical protein
VASEPGAERKATIKNTPAEPADEKMNSTIKLSEELSHPSSCKCGYPVRPGLLKCPKCGQSLVLTDPVPFAEKRSSTIDPYRNDTQPRCSFTLIPRDDNETEKTIVAEGSTTMLTRELLESSNNTISSSSQAEIAYIDGEWFITDKSSLESTFVLARKAVKLTKGDIILIGNRKFRFEG